MNTFKALLMLSTSMMVLWLLPFPVQADPSMMGGGDWHDKMMHHKGPGYGMGMGYGRMGMMGGRMGQCGMGMMGGGMGMMNMMGGGMSPMMMQMLNLNDKQKAKLREFSHEQRKSHCENMNSMMDIRDELAEAYAKDEPDAKAIGKIYSKMFDKRRQMIEQSIETHNKMRAVLNKEQQEKFDNMHRGGGMGMMGSGMGYGGMGMME